MKELTNGPGESSFAIPSTSDCSTAKKPKLDEDNQRELTVSIRK